MTPTMIVVILRALGMVFINQDKQAMGEVFRLLANTVAAGKAVDDHMKDVAESLTNGAGADWESVKQRITNASARLQAKPPVTTGVATALAAAPNTTPPGK